jgi:hypothetical protein
MKSGSNSYYPSILQALRDIQVAHVEMQSKVVKVRDLNDSMILAEDVCTKGGVLLAAKDQHVSLSVRRLLRNHIDQNTILDTINVLIPSGKIQETDATPVQPASV